MGRGAEERPLGETARRPGTRRKNELYKTEMCRSFSELGFCRYGERCQFGHSVEELRVVPRHPKYRTAICRTYWLQGACPYGRRCCFAHGEARAVHSGAHSAKHSAAHGGARSGVPERAGRRAITAGAVRHGLYGAPGFVLQMAGTQSLAGVAAAPDEDDVACQAIGVTASAKHAPQPTRGFFARDLIAAASTRGAADCAWVLPTRPRFAPSTPLPAAREGTWECSAARLWGASPLCYVQGYGEGPSADRGALSRTHGR